MKNFAYIAGKPKLPKSDGLQTDIAKTRADNSGGNFAN